MQTRFCRTQIPRTLECVVLVFVLKTNIENFTINNKFVDLSAFQIVKELDFLMKTIFKEMVELSRIELLRARQALSQELTIFVCQDMGD